MQIEDSYERWHPFDPAAFDGTQLIYPGAHADRFPPDSRAASASRARNPRLCRVSAYSLPGLPRPTIKP